MNNFLTSWRLRKFETIQKCIVPRVIGFSAEQLEESRALINNFLSERNWTERCQLALFILFIDFVSLVTQFKLFEKLTDHVQNRVLYWFFDSSVPLFRKGFWGLSALAKLGVYGQSSIYKDIGFQLRDVPQKSSNGGANG